MTIAGFQRASWRLGLSAFVLAAALPGAASAQSRAVEPQAQELLVKALTYISRQERFSVVMRASYDSYQQSGQKIEFGETRKVTLIRPDRLRVEIEESNGVSHVMLFDGKDLTLSTPQSNVYAQLPKPGTIDQAVVFFVRDLRMRLPLAVLLLTTATDELTQRTLSIDYVEKTSILGKPAHHLAGRTESVDYQIWLADGEQPLLMRVVLTYHTEPGQPQYRAMLSDWNLAPQVQDSVFAFTAPSDARRIAFLAEMPRATNRVGRQGRAAGVRDEVQGHATAACRIGRTEMISKSALLTVSIAATLLVLAASADTATAQRGGRSTCLEWRRRWRWRILPRRLCVLGQLFCGRCAGFFGSVRSAKHCGEPLPGPILRADGAAGPLGGSLSNAVLGAERAARPIG